MNCSHAAVRAFADVAGWNACLVISARLTSRGFGSIRVVADSYLRSMGTLRPNREPAIPIDGSVRSLYVPSIVRVSRSAGSDGPTGGRLTAGSCSGSYRLRSRRTTRTPKITRRPSGGGRRSQPSLRSIAIMALPSARPIAELRRFGTLVLNTVLPPVVVRDEGSGDVTPVRRASRGRALGAPRS